ncbi:hypothetical protein TH9_16475 [Thalassospira xiamenensis]|nr:hypothetical protein TH9_16475 [Thalassospira xiamenensis]
MRTFECSFEHLLRCKTSQPNPPYTIAQAGPMRMSEAKNGGIRDLFIDSHVRHAAPKNHPIKQQEYASRTATE